MAGPVDLVQIRQLLAEKDARWLDGSDGTRHFNLLGDSEIQRVWTESVKDYQAQMLEYIDLYTSADNSTALKYVDNPLVDNEPFYGRWRQVECRPIQRGDQVWMLQILRKGYLESVVSSGAVVYTEARVAARTAYTKDIATGGVSATEDYLVIEWKNCSPYKVKFIVDELESAPPDFFNPTIKGEDFGTLWHRQFVADKIENDGSATVTLFLCRPEYILTAPRVWLTSQAGERVYHWNVPKSIAQALIDANRGLGKSITPQYNKEPGLVDIVVDTRTFTGGALYSQLNDSQCDSKVYVSTYFDVVYPELYTIPMSPPPGYHYSRVDSNLKDGGYDVRIIVDVRQLRNYDYIYTDRASLVDTEVYMQRGVTTDATLMSLPAPVQAVVYSRNLQVQDDCSKDQDISRTESKEASAVHVASSTPWSNEIEVMYENFRTIPALPGIHPVESSRFDMNRDKTYSGKMFLESLSTYGELYYQSEGNVDVLESTAIYKGRVTRIDAPVADYNGMYRAANEFDERTGLYNSRLVYDVVLQRKFEHPSVNSALRRESEFAFLSNHPAAVLLTTDYQADGFIYERSISGGQNGTWNGTMRAIENQFYGNTFVSRLTPFLQEDTYLYENAPLNANPSIDHVTEPTQGEVTLNGRYGQDMKFSGEYVYRKSRAGAQVAIPIGGGPLDEEFEILYHRKPSAIQAPASGRAGLYRVNGTIDDMGLYGGSLVYQVSKESTVGFTWTSNNGQVYMYDVQNQRTFSAPALNPASTNSFEGFTVNRDGTYSYKLVSRTNGADGKPLFDDNWGTILLYLRGDNDEWFYFREKYTGSKDTAQAFITEPPDPVPVTGYKVVSRHEDKRTGIDWLGGSKFHATRVEVLIT